MGGHGGFHGLGIEWRLERGDRMARGRRRERTGGMEAAGLS